MKAIVSLFMLVCLSAGLVTGPAAAAAAAVLTEGDHFLPQAATVTRYMTLSGLDFRPTVPADLYTLTDDGGIYPDSAAGQFAARVELPEDASVTDVTFFFVDNNPSANMTFMFKKNSLYGISLDIWPPVTNTSSGSQLQSISICPPSCVPYFVGTGAYSYHLLVNFGAAGSTQALFGARITYTEPVVPVPDDNLTLVGTDFRPASSEVNYAANSSSIYCPSNPSSCSFMAPLVLPQGSQITQIIYYVVDNSSDNNLALHLYGFNPSTQSLVLLNDSTTAGLPDSPEIQFLTVQLNPPIIVDNTTRSYAIGIQPTVASMEQQIAGVHIHYTPGPASNFQARTLAGFDFTPNLSKVDFSISGGAIFAQGGGSTGPFTANLDLPDGDAIYSLTFYFKKISGTGGNLTFAVKSYTPGSRTRAVLQSYNTNAFPSSDAVQQLSFVGTVDALGRMDTQHTNLRLEVTPSAADNRLVLVGARVQHFYPVWNYFPVIKK